MQAITMSSKEKCWQGSEQMGITSKEFFGQKHRVVRYCHSCENSMQWQRAVRSRLYSEWAREGYCNLFTLVHLSNLILLSVNTSNTLSLNGVYSFREQNNPHPPLSPPFKVGLFVVFYKWLQQWHYVTWRVWGRKSFIFLFSSWQNVRKVL